MRVILISALTLSLLGCQCFAPVSASGSIQRGAVIEVQGTSSVFSNRPTLYELTVYDQNSDSPKPLWQVTGKGRVSSVTYGTVPTGMSEDAPARPLEIGHVYIVGVYGDTAGSILSGSYCRGRLRFKVNSSGEIVNCSEEGSACG